MEFNNCQKVTLVITFCNAELSWVKLGFIAFTWAKSLKVALVTTYHIVAEQNWMELDFIALLGHIT